jgi:hypothetical protein
MNSKLHVSHSGCKAQVSVVQFAFVFQLHPDVPVVLFFCLSTPNPEDPVRLFVRAHRYECEPVFLRRTGTMDNLRVTLGAFPYYLVMKERQ